MPHDPITTVKDLRDQMDHAARSGYGDWRVLVFPTFEPDPEHGGRYTFLGTRDHEVCGLSDPGDGDPDAGVLLLTFKEATADQPTGASTMAGDHPTGTGAGRPAVDQ